MFQDPSFTAHRIGERRPSGDLARDASVCFVTGKAIVPGDVTITLSGTHFIRVKAQVWAHLSRDEKDAVRTEALSQAQSTASTQGVNASTLPDYDSMSVEDLRAKATERGIDLEGARNKSQIIARFRLADVQARFADIPAEGSV
jgi:hypothetical protein